MRIIKYRKLKSGKYLIEFENSNLEIYEEAILKCELLLKKDIEASEYEFLIKENQFWACYYSAVKYIKVRSRSISEVKNKLIKENYLFDDIDRCIQKLLEQGYLNDEVYANSFFHEQLITTSRGPRKIGDELRKKGISEEIIQQVISLYDEGIQYDKLSKIISKMIRSNRNKSNSLLQKKIYTDLLREGFSKSVIDQIIQEQNFNDDEEIKNREYEKIRKRLSKKYQGYDLERKIKEQMFRKGFYL